MKAESFKTLALFIVITVVQVMILSHIRLFGFASPMMQVYFVALFKRGYPKWGILVWAFLMGLILDSFSNTPGVGTSSLTLIAMLQPMVLEMFMQRESDPDLQPSVAFLGPLNFFVFSAILSLVYCLVFFTLENFSFFNWEQWLSSVLGCFVFTMIVIMVMEIARPIKK